MKSTNEKAASRPLGVAEKLVNQKIDEAAVYSKIVILTGETEALETKNGRWCFIDAISLLSRVVGNLTVILPSGTDSLFEKQVNNFCIHAWRRGTLNIVRDVNPAIFKTADAILSIGAKANPSLPWTTINSSGWVARVTSGTTSLPNSFKQENAPAALFAASLGVTEVFKRIFNIPHETAPLLNKTEFSLFEQTTNPTWIGPPLPDKITIPDTLLNGAGAIGNGIALLFSQTPFEGRVHIIDKQNYNEENLGTCILLNNESWLQQSKAKRMATWLNKNSKLEATGDKSLIETAIQEQKFSGLAIDLVLNGFDDVNARNSSQNLWPSTIIDGGINEVGAAVIQHRLDQNNFACLKCWFEPKKINEHTIQSKLTGLDITSLKDTGRPLTDNDIAHAKKDNREWLKKHKNSGKTICSIISEAVLAAKLGVDVDEGFRPSAPFVATASAALVVAEAIKSLEFPKTPIVPMFQIANLFLGPEQTSIKLKKQPLATCQCVVHRRLIDQILNKRKQSVEVV